jgi:hypothetical protein
VGQLYLLRGRDGGGRVRERRSRGTHSTQSSAATITSPRRTVVPTTTAGALTGPGSAHRALRRDPSRTGREAHCRQLGPCGPARSRTIALVSTSDTGVMSSSRSEVNLADLWAGASRTGTPGRRRAAGWRGGGGGPGRSCASAGWSPVPGCGPGYGGVHHVGEQDVRLTLAQDGDDRAGRRLGDAQRESVLLPASAGTAPSSTRAPRWRGHEFVQTRSGLAERRPKCHRLLAARRSATDRAVQARQHRACGGATRL